MLKISATYENIIMKKFLIKELASVPDGLINFSIIAAMLMISFGEAKFFYGVRFLAPFLPILIPLAFLLAGAFWVYQRYYKNAVPS